MTIPVDQVMVPSRDPLAAARPMPGLLGAPRSPIACGGRIVHWNELGGHQWAMLTYKPELTHSHDRPARPAGACAAA
jgi:hypothetical protein